MCILNVEAMSTEQIIPLFGTCEGAARELIRRHKDEVYAVCYTHTRNAQDAQDASQNTWVRVQELHASFEGRGEGSGRAWLLTLAHWEGVNVGRRSSRGRRRFDHGLDVEALGGAEAGGPLGLVELLPDLPPWQQAVLMLANQRARGSGTNPGRDVALLLAINHVGVTPQMDEALASLRRRYTGAC